MKQKQLGDIARLLLSIFICESAGIIGSLFTMSAVRTWYLTLNKPFFNPPSWVFGPVWTLLYALMGVSAFLIWKAGWKKRAVREALSLFGVQLLINSSWSIVFFRMQSPLFGLFTIFALWLMIISCVLSFYRISKTASYLLIPYLFWVSFALCLNFAIVQLN